MQVQILKSVSDDIAKAAEKYISNMKNFKRVGKSFFKIGDDIAIKVVGNKGFEGYHVWDDASKKFTTRVFKVKAGSGAASATRLMGKITVNPNIAKPTKTPPLPEAPKVIKDAVKEGNWNKVKAWLKKHKVTIGAAGAGALGGYILSDD
jgi:hypothetical protein